MIGQPTSCYAFSFPGNWHDVYIPTEYILDSSITALLLNPDKSVRACGREAFFQFETNDLEDCYFIPQMVNVFDSEKVSFKSNKCSRALTLKIRLLLTCFYKLFA